MTKTPLTFTNNKFDLKMLVCGNSGSGKTYFSATYNGPIHYYMLDKGGEKTLKRFLLSRDHPITIDDFSKESDKFSAFWKQLQKDEKDGFFNEMAEKEGLIVVDSLTSANMKAISEIAKLSSLPDQKIGRKYDPKAGLKMGHWGQLLNWNMTLISALQELPCAVLVTVHLHIVLGEENEVVARYPSVNGQFRQLLGKDFDEVYLIESVGSSRILYMQEKNKFEAKTREFTAGRYKNISLNNIYEAYVNGEQLIKG